MITNEVRRTKEKLRLFDQEGLNGLLFDLIEMINKDEGDGNWTEEGKIWLVDQLKQKYLKVIDDNSEKSRQGKLF